MNSVVIDLGFGDSGKGRVVDWLCKTDLNPNRLLIVRYSGGSQAGHTVVNKGIRHVFSNFGSGTLAGVESYWNCLFDPIAFLTERSELERKGISPKISVDPNCPIITVWDKMANQSNKKYLMDGTCGCGIGTTITRSKTIPFMVNDLFVSSTILQLKFKSCADFYGYDSSTTNYLEEFLESVEEIKNLIIVKELDHSKVLIFESSQGLLLDEFIGFYPNVTWGNLGLNGLPSKSKISQIYYVIRAYQTRHGNGPMTNESLEKPFSCKDSTNVSNIYQGHFRTTVLDLDLIMYSLNKSRENYSQYFGICETLIVTCVDEMIEFQLTLDSKLVKFQNKKDFIAFISNKLRIRHVLISESDDGDLNFI